MPRLHRQAHDGGDGAQRGAITPNYRYFGGPSFSIPGTTKKFRDWRRWGHGWLDVYRAIEVSADTYFYDLAYRVGIDKINSYMTKFGFGQYSGVDLYEETRGVMPSRDWKMARWRQPWYQGTPSPSASARATGAPPRSSSPRPSAS